MYYRLIAACLLFTLGGCQILGNNDEALLQLETNKLEFRVGEDLQLTLINLSGVTYTVHPQLCGASLQMSTNAGWQTVAREEVCTRIGLELSPGQEALTLRSLDSRLESGRYRYEYVIEGITVHSPYFEIIA